MREMYCHQIEHEVALEVVVGDLGFLDDWVAVLKIGRLELEKEIDHKEKYRSCSDHVNRVEWHETLS
jgi:hypothetical protein